MDNLAGSAFGERLPALARQDGSARDAPGTEAAELLSLRREIVGDAISRLVTALEPSPVRVTGLVISPAGGVCGWARSGPIDAIRDRGALSLMTRHPSRVPVAVRVLDVQQTRCWLLAADLHMPADGEPRVLARADILVLPPPVCTDTARAMEYLHDSGLGHDWPGLLLLGSPRAGAGRIAQVLCAFTETAYLDACAGGGPAEVLS